MATFADNEFIVTGDGSHTLRNRRFAVPYHSTHGAIQESNHVFIQTGLDAFVAESGRKSVNVLELGFGSGLNALLTQLYAENKAGLAVDYYSLEAFPIDLEIARQLNYGPLLGKPAEELLNLHQSPYDEALRSITAAFRLAKSTRDLLLGLPDAWSNVPFDVIFYDAFAPASQPELWSPEALRICFDALAVGGCLVTYCAQGQFKRDLRSVGFTVEPKPGPPGKREMTRGTKYRQG